MRNYSAQDVDAYIKTSDPAAQLVMQNLRTLIKSTIPQAEESISWGVPFYKYQGLLAGFSVFKNHISFGLVFPLNPEDQQELSRLGYTTGKKTIQIKFDQAIPKDIIVKMLLTQAKQNEISKSKKSKK